MALQDGIKKVARKKDLPPMPDAPFERLLDLLRIQSFSGEMYEMQVYVINELRSIKDVTADFDKEGNILITKGKADVFPCIVAHMDTVHHIKPGKISIFSYKKAKQKVLIAKDSKDKPTGIGGDDKNGVFAVLEMVRRVRNIKAALFVDEEVGCLGSSNVDHAFFYDVGYLLQLDRWGNSDVVNDMWGKTTCDLFDKAILPVMQKYAYTFNTGLMTDALTLHDDDIGVSAVNISCGYYQHHTDNERIVVEELWDAINMTHEFIKTLGNVKYESTSEAYTPYSEYGSYKKGVYDGYAEGYKPAQTSSPTAVERYMKNQERTDLTAADIYQNLYDRLSNWDELPYHEQEEVRDDWVFLYGVDITPDEIAAYKIDPAYLGEADVDATEGDDDDK